MSNVASEADSLRAARSYLLLGWAPIPIPRGKKGPCLQGWQSIRLKESDLPQHFRNGANIGLLLGATSGDLVDIDLDAPEAVSLGLALLPPTNRVHGRKSRPGSHCWYQASPPPAPIKFTDLDGTCLVELRSNGQQTLVPPSTHPTGEVLRWEREGEPSRVDAGDLRQAVARLAAAALLARRWPSQGRRHEASLALAGSLLKAGWSEEQVTNFVLGVARAAGDEESRERGEDVRSTAQKIFRGGKTTGIPRLADVFGKQMVDRVCEWLELGTSAVETHKVILPSWPTPPAAEAFYGLAGDIVRAIQPRSEADPIALLAQTLAAYGNVVGRGPHFVAEEDEHPLQIWPVLVGTTSKGRKGSSWSQIRRILAEVDPLWAEERIQSGLSSGEGLIWSVRDPVVRLRVGRKKDRDGDAAEYHGVSDKRLLVLEPEFASLLKVAGREGNTLSAIIRLAWDRGDLQSLTKQSPARATKTLITIVGHITRDELLRYLSTTETANGFANRFLWLAVRRSNVLPEGGRLDKTVVSSLADPLRNAVEFAKGRQELRRDEAARAIWYQVYPDLSEGHPGLLGAATSRAEAQVMRLACIYACLDCSPVVRKEHLKAALAFWEYCEASARFIFGEALGDPVADELLRTLRNKPEGLTRTQIRDLFGRNRRAEEIQGALTRLAEYGLAEPDPVPTDAAGRPAERWKLVQRTTTKTTETTKVGH